MNTQSNIKVRKATLEDITKIAEIHNKSALSAYNGLLEPDVADKIFGREVLYKDWYRYITEAETNPQLLPLVAVDEKGAITGAARANVGNITEKEVFEEIGFETKRPIDRTAHLKNIYIDPESQSQGVGKHLIVEVAKWAKEKQCLNMITMTLDKYEQSPQFFQRVAGARHIGRCESDVSAMYKNLPQGSVVLNFNVYNMMSMDYIIQKNKACSTTATPRKNKLYQTAKTGRL